MAEKPRFRHRRRAASSEPQLTSPLPLTTPSPIGGGGKTDTDACPGRNQSDHHHHHHPTARGLSKHLRILYGHSWALNMIEDYGFDSVLAALDHVTDLYGLYLDAPLQNAGRSRLELAPQPPPQIHNPAGLITFHVRRIAERKRQAQPSADAHPHLRAVGGTDG